MIAALLTACLAADDATVELAGERRSLAQAAGALQGLAGAASQRPAEATSGAIPALPQLQGGQGLAWASQRVLAAVAALPAAMPPPAPADPQTGRPADPALWPGQEDPGIPAGPASQTPAGLSAADAAWYQQVDGCLVTLEQAQAALLRDWQVADHELVIGTTRAQPLGQAAGAYTAAYEAITTEIGFLSGEEAYLASIATASR